MARFHWLTGAGNTKFEREAPADGSNTTIHRVLVQEHSKIPENQDP